MGSKCGTQSHQGYGIYLLTVTYFGVGLGGMFSEVRDRIILVLKGNVIEWLSLQPC